jgi:hypothetical protein
METLQCYSVITIDHLEKVLIVLLERKSSTGITSLFMDNGLGIIGRKIVPEKSGM